MPYYDPYQRSSRQQPVRTLTLDQIKQIEATLQELEQEAAKWKELARKWEAVAKEEHQKVTQLEDQLQEQIEKADRAGSESSLITAAGEIVSEEQQAASAEAKEKIRKMEQHLEQAQAEYENARKRLETRFSNQLDQNIMEFLRDLLPVLDNLNRAIQHAPTDTNGDGVKMTRQMFLSALDKYGVKPIKALGETFDPEYHEALGVLEDAELPPNTVAAVDQDGYIYRDKLLRPARVLITPEE